MLSLTSELKAFAVIEGADLVGIAPVSRWEYAPLELSPLGIWPSSKSVISIAVNLTDAGKELCDVEDPQKASLGAGTGIAWCRLDHVSHKIGKFLQRNGFDAIPVVCTSLWRYRPYKNFDNGNSFLPDISHIHAGVAAGLGEFGYNGLLITPEFGPNVRLATIITNAPLISDPLYDGPALCDKCMRCVKECKRECAQALCKEVDGMCEVRIEDKTYKYAKINKWRCAWGEHFALDLKTVPPPENVTEHSVVEAMERNDVKGWTNGRCQVYCMPPHLRHIDPAYCKPPRRKRQFSEINQYHDNNKIISDEINKIAVGREADLLCFLSREDALKELKLDLKEFLPDATSAIIVGVENIRIPEFEKNKKEHVNYSRIDYPKMNELKESFEEGYKVTDVAQQRVVFIGLDMTRYLEGLGYSVLCCIQTLGVFGEKINAFIGKGQDLRLGIMLTNAVFPSAMKSDLKKRNNNKSKLKSSSELSFMVKSLALAKGADLVGFSSVERIDKITSQLEKILASEGTEYFTAHDVGRMSKGPFIPKIVSEKLKVRKASEYLPNARSIIVLGMHFFDAVVKNAGANPAEVVGPYGLMQSETISQLDDIALSVIKKLKIMGYESTYSYDLNGLASLVTGSCASGRSYYGMPWRGPGLYPDMTANNFAAVAAGLGELGWSGTVLTPEFGPRQRFTVIITEAPLEESPLYKGSALCSKCMNCVTKCPTKAIGKKGKHSVEIEGKTFEYGIHNRLRCDWSKRYALVGEEGPKYIGSITNIMPPKGDITPHDLSEALKKMDPLQKGCMVIVENCIKNCNSLILE
ncbi:MAG: hypothetical protein WCV67_05865 [Victivallaceae bacterium]|jgi:epoxyqueuosine reductase QueG